MVTTIRWLQRLQHHLHLDNIGGNRFSNSNLYPYCTRLTQFLTYLVLWYLRFHQYLGMQHLSCGLFSQLRVAQISHICWTSLARWTQLYANHLNALLENSITEYICSRMPQALIFSLMMWTLADVNFGVALQMPLTRRWLVTCSNSLPLELRWMWQYQLCLNSQPLSISEGDKMMYSHLSKYLHYISSLNKLLSGAYKQIPRQLWLMLSTTIATRKCRVSTRSALMVRDCAPLPARGGGHFLIRLFSPTCFGLVQGFSCCGRRWFYYYQLLRLSEALPLTCLGWGRRLWFRHCFQYSRVTILISEVNGSTRASKSIKKLALPVLNPPPPVIKGGSVP